MTSRLFQPLSAVTIMVSMLLRQLRRSLQIKKIITNSPCVLQFAAQSKHIINNSEIGWLLGHLWRRSKRSKSWLVMTFIHSASEIRVYRVSSGNKFDGVQLVNLYFKIKSIKSKATFLRASFLKLQIIRLVQGLWSCTPTHQNSYFYSYTYENSFSSSFY